MSDTLLNPYFGEFGGMYVPEILVPVLKQLEKAFVEAQFIQRNKKQALSKT